MLPHRTAYAAALATVTLVLGAAATGCSGSDDGGGSPDAPLTKDLGPRSVTAYTATRPNSGTPSAEDMKVTASRLRKRAAALGLRNTDVKVDGTVVTVSGPRSEADQLQKIAVTALLEFRPVLDPSAAGKNGLGKAYDSMVCEGTTRAVPSLPERPTVACDRAANQKYLLGPTDISGTEVAGASAAVDSANGNGWVVNLTFSPAGSTKFGQVTGELARNTQPANQFAVLIDGDVISAPAVASAITGGKAQITGTYTREQAQDLAVTIDSGALPVQLTAKGSGTEE